MEGCICGVLILAFLLCPVILQGYGLFGKEWITATSCEALDYIPACCNRTSIHSTCHGPFGLDDLNLEVYVIQWIAFVLLIIPSGWVLLVICCAGAAGDSCNSYMETFYCYLAAGVLCLIGCMVIVGVYHGQSFGKTFTISVFSGLVALVFSGVLFCSRTKKKGTDVHVRLNGNNEAATQDGGV